MLKRYGKKLFGSCLAIMILLLCGCSEFQHQLNEAIASSEISPHASTIEKSEQDNLIVRFLDVGQGNSLIITINGKTLLLDGGDNGKEDLMFSYMKQYNIKKIDVLIGSHPDADHIGTLPELIDAMEIGAVYLPKATSNTKTYENLLTSIQKKGLKIKTAKKGVVIDLDKDVKIEMLAPIQNYDDNNNMSAVVKITYDQISFLLPGDAEYSSEQDMLKSGADLSSTVLAVAHHGSNSSSGKGFIQKVQPEYAVIQVGADNKYGHPTSKTLKKFEDQNVKVLRTDKNGTITFTTDGKSLKVSTQK